MLGKYKEKPIPPSLKPPTKKVTMLDFMPRTWACLADPNVNNNSEYVRGLPRPPYKDECAYLNKQYDCDSCALNFNTNPITLLEWLVEHNSIDKEVALQILLTKETTGDKI